MERIRHISRLPKQAIFKKISLVLLLAIFQFMTFSANATICDNIAFTGYTLTPPTCGLEDGSIAFTVDNPDEECVFYTLYHFETEVWYVDYNTTPLYENLPPGHYKITAFIDGNCNPDWPEPHCFVKSEILNLVCEDGCSARFDFIDGIGEFICGGNDGKIVHRALDATLPYRIEYMFEGSVYSTYEYTTDEVHFIFNLAPGVYSDIKLIDADDCEFLHPEPIIINPCPASLPIDLISFEARSTGEQEVLLKWVTASEEDNSHFIIERSLDAREYEAIGVIGGSGTSNSANVYTFTDTKAFYGLNYYRLKQVDFDNNYEYYSTEAVNVSAKDNPNIMVYPNPVQTTTTLRVISPYEGDVKVEIVDNSGSLLKVVNIERGKNSTQLDLSDLSAGMYYLYVNSKGNRISVQNVVKID